jgi:hypothetical protein
MEYYADVKKDEILSSFCRKMNGTGDHDVM